LIKKDKINGIKKTSATGTRTSIKEIDEVLFNNAGIRNGSKKAITKFVSKIEITVYSIFLFSKLIIIGDAIAVGAIAVINTT
jgi:hypothetical protein